MFMLSLSGMSILPVGVGEWFGVLGDDVVLFHDHCHGGLQEVGMCRVFSLLSTAVAASATTSGLNMPVTQRSEFLKDVTTLTAFVDWEGVYAFSAFRAFNAHNITIRILRKRLS